MHHNEKACHMVFLYTVIKIFQSLRSHHQQVFAAHPHQKKLTGTALKRTTLDIDLIVVLRAQDERPNSRGVISPFWQLGKKLVRYLII